MEDKELQELFAAKRTSEANRRRQKELRRMLMATTPKANPKSRRLWPLWLGSAAAALLLLLLLIPALFRQPETTPMLTARNETPTPTPQAETFVLKETPSETPQKKATKKIATIEAIEKIEKIEAIKPEYYAEEQEPAIEPEPTKIDNAETSEFRIPNSEPSTPRIHRRTSTSMVCSNCNINNVPSQSTALQNFLAATFGTDPNTPFTLKNIEF